MATLSMTDSQLNAYNNAINGWQTATTTTLGGVWQDLTTSAAQQQQAYQYYVQTPSAWSNSVANAIRKIKFWRVNKVVEMDEGARFDDPLDELRLKIARWLNPTEKYNLAT